MRRIAGTRPIAGTKIRGRRAMYTTVRMNLLVLSKETETTHGDLVVRSRGRTALLAAMTMEANRGAIRHEGNRALAEADSAEEAFTAVEAAVAAAVGTGKQAKASALITTLKRYDMEKKYAAEEDRS